MSTLSAISASVVVSSSGIEATAVSGTALCVGIPRLVGKRDATIAFSIDSYLTSTGIFAVCVAWMTRSVRLETAATFLAFEGTVDLGTM